MLAKLGTLLGRKDTPSADRRIECFGASRIERSLGDEILRATPARRNHLQGIRDRLSSMTLEDKDELVDRLFARVALFVFDLPASQSSHHSERFGLFEHLLEVAHQTVREVAAPGFEVSPEHSTNHRERPLWAYAGLVAAIAHDIGKPLDLDVAAPGTGKRWDPIGEPLRLFCERHRLEKTGPELWHFHVGRGLRGHENFITTLLPLVLTREVEEYLGPRLGSVIDAMTLDREWKLVGGRPHPAQEVVRIVRRIDGATSRKDVQAERSKAAEPARPVVPRPPVAPPPSVPQQQSLPFPPIVPVKAEPSAEREVESEDLPLFMPPDFRPDPVPEAARRRGDPTEIASRLKKELDPARFIDTLRRLVIARRLSRNNLYTDVYIRPDFVWLVVPRALRRVARIIHLPWDTDALENMLEALRSSTQVAPGDAGRGTVFVKTRTDVPSCQAVRIITRGFLTESELGCLKVYDYALQVLGPAPVELGRAP